jgi:hypothetical protein
MSKLNINRKLFLEQEELVKFQEFIADSPSENAIIGNTNSWGILRTDFTSDTDFKVELGSNAGTIKIAKAENKALTAEGNRILQKAVDNIQITNDDSWYWVRISHEFSNQEPGTVNININGQVSGDGTEFISVLRGQSTKVPTKVRFVKQDGSPANNSAFYDVVDVIDNQNCILSSAVDFSAESDLKMVVLGTTPIGEALSASQEEGLYKYDSCNLELVPEVVTDTPPTNGYTEDLTFYIARVKNNGGTVTIEDKRTEYWEFNIVGLTDKLSTFNNLSDLNDPDTALENLGLSTAGVNLAKLDVLTENGYLRINTDGTVSLLTGTGFVSSLNTALSNVFLKKSNNLSDLTDKASARSNLDVYNKSSIDTLNWAQLSDNSNADYTIDTTNAYIAKTLWGEVKMKGTISVTQVNAVPFVIVSILGEDYRPTSNKFTSVVLGEDELDMSNSNAYISTSGGFILGGGTYTINLDQISYFID